MGQQPNFTSELALIKDQANNFKVEVAQIFSHSQKAYFILRIVIFFLEMGYFLVTLFA